MAAVRRLPCIVRSPMNKRGGGWLSTHAHQEPAGGAGGAQDDDEPPTKTTTQGGKDATAHAYRLVSSLSLQNTCKM